MSHNNKILRRYVKKNALFAIFTAVIALWLLQAVFSYLGEMDNISDEYTLTHALWFIFYKSPDFLEQFIPTGALLGAVIGLGILANKSELLIIQASGISTFRIVGWVLQPAILFVVLALAINQFVLPTSNLLADQVSETKKEQNTDDILSVRGYWTVQPNYVVKNGKTYANGKDVLYIDYANVEGDIGLIKKWHLDNQGTLQSVAVATGGRYIGKADNANQYVKIQHQWQLNNVSEIKIARSLGTKQVKQNSHILTLPIAPQSVYLLTRKAEDLSLTQLYAHRQFMHSQGNRSLEHEVAFWQKLLSPLSILSLVVVACSFVFGSLRTHSLGLRIVVAMIFGLLFSYMQDLVGFIALSTAWSPFLMVLLPIVASAIFGVGLLKFRR